MESAKLVQKDLKEDIAEQAAGLTYAELVALIYKVNSAREKKKTTL